MRSILAIFLAGTVALGTLIPGMELTELNKIPELIGHYHEHQVINIQLSLIDFLELHYIDSDHHKKDHKRHDQLPFNDHHQHKCQLLQVVFTLPEVQQQSEQFFTSCELNDHYRPIVGNAITPTIWQPPRKV